MSIYKHVAFQACHFAGSNCKAKKTLSPKWTAVISVPVTSLFAKSVLAVHESDTADSWTTCVSRGLRNTMNNALLMQDGIADVSSSYNQCIGK